MRLSVRYLVAVFIFSLIWSALVSLHAAGHGPTTLTPPSAILYCLARSGLFFLAFSFLGVPMGWVCLSLYRATHHRSLLHCLLFGMLWGCGTMALLGVLLALGSFALSASGHEALNWPRALTTSALSGAVAGLVFWSLTPVSRRMATL
ncbi:hypothetical protein NKW54_08795 [Acetobacter cerevisiae]|uniref:Uncharacterized protein n=1 Tax=Acetobacter cerevisiae TaxID=178900 RepID=A0A149UTM9_9PROT|nr:hypothetical protein [Acetobacter cerevisiae]KXV71349.1 hypothetical protein AD952_09345 [Acetobacter cerevisiae]MCP1246035.1 hypothetical protein [Acetobacter cerevisiae]MCP1255508.1 hypothetical protein [Acetobacter cerevisiae]